MVGGVKMAQNKQSNMVSDSTYNLLAILLSKLEGLEAYDTYLEDMDGEGKKIIEQIRRDDERHAEMLRSFVEQLVQSGGLK
jgi:rubrerythrin